MSTNKIRFTASAQGSYTAAVEYLLEQNPFAAERFVSDVDAALKRVQRFPHIGSVVRETAKGPIRQFWVLPYQFLYRLEGDTVLIVAEWHSAQPTAPPADTDD